MPRLAFSIFCRLSLLPLIAGMIGHYSEAQESKPLTDGQKLERIFKAKKQKHLYLISLQKYRAIALVDKNEKLTHFFVLTPHCFGINSRVDKNDHIKTTFTIASLLGYKADNAIKIAEDESFTLVRVKKYGSRRFYFNKSFFDVNLDEAIESFGQGSLLLTWENNRPVWTSSMGRNQLQFALNLTEPTTRSIEVTCSQNVVNEALFTYALNSKFNLGLSEDVEAEDRRAWSKLIGYSGSTIARDYEKSIFVIKGNSKLFRLGSMESLKPIIKMPSYEWAKTEDFNFSSTPISLEEARANANRIKAIERLKNVEEKDKPKTELQPTQVVQPKPRLTPAEALQAYLEEIGQL